jgi:hypothetical protein
VPPWRRPPAATTASVNAWVDTCPKRTYRMTDATYVDRVDASRDLALSLVIAIAPELAQVRLFTPIAELTAQALAVTMACHALADARRDADADKVVADFDAAVAEELPKAKDTPLYRGLETVRAEQLAKAAAAWTAFSEVCRGDLGVEPSVVLAAHVGEEFVAELGLGALDGVKPGKSADKWREVFRRGARGGGG